MPPQLDNTRLRPLSASSSAAAAIVEQSSRDPRVSAVLMRMLADVAASYQVAHGRLFPHANDELMTGDPLELHVPLTQYRSALSRAVELSGEPSLALRCSLVNAPAVHLLAPLIAHVKTLRQAFQELRQFQPLLFEGATMRLVEGGGRARFSFDFPRADQESDRLIAEFVLSGITRMLQAFGGTSEELLAVHFVHRRPVYYHAYTAFFGGAERFEADYTGIEFVASRLDAPNVYHNPALHNIVYMQAEHYLARLTTPTSISERLLLYFRAQPDGQVPQMTDAARALGLSVRSLRRRLSEEGLSYRDLAQRVQNEFACRALRNRDFTLQHVADSLGFADTPSFCRAFKRWTGLTASEYRARELQARIEGRTA